MPASTRTTIVPGVELERRWLPVSSVGVYAPGGSAPYPVVARHGRRAGARRRRRTGSSSPARRTARATSTRCCSGPPGLLGVDALLVAGGVQAIGALAYGLAGRGPRSPSTSIVGPGSAWVTAAKIEVVGEVGHRPARRPVRGPRPRRRAPPMSPTVAADLVTQAEHGSDSPALLVTPDEALRRRGRGRGPAPPRDAPCVATSSPARSPTTAGSSSSRTSPPASTSSTATARSTSRWTSRTSRAPSTAIRNAGSIFVGRWSPGVGGRLRLGREPRPARPAASPAPAARSRWRRSASSTRCSASPARASRRCARHPHPRRGRGAAGAPRRGGGALRG